MTPLDYILRSLLGRRRSRFQPPPPPGHNYPEPANRRPPPPPRTFAAPDFAAPVVLLRGYGCLACGGEIGFERGTRMIRCLRCRRIHHLTLAPGMDRQPEDSRP